MIALSDLEELVEQTLAPWSRGSAVGAVLEDFLRRARGRALRQEASFDPDLLGALLRHRRLQLGLSQEALAARLGMHRVTVGRTENGAGYGHPVPSRPRRAVLERWCDVLELRGGATRAAIFRAAGYLPRERDDAGA